MRNELIYLESQCERQLKQIEALKAEIAKLREDKAETILNAWYASSAWTLGGMRWFTQRHPNLQEYLKQELNITHGDEPN